MLLLVATYLVKKEEAMRWPVFEQFPTPKPRPKTMAERLKEAEHHVKLPRQVHHAIERDRRISFDEVRDVELAAAQELVGARGRGTADLEALVAGSQEEMKMLYKQLSLSRNILKKLERSYLYHYHRNDIGQRMLAEVQVIKPGVSGRPAKDTLKHIKLEIDKLNPEEQAIAKRLLNMT